MNKQKLIELRCKAWGITEDEYYCNQCSDFSLEDMARAYRRGKNKGARDKAIQNVGFYQKQMQDIYDKKNKQIAELEKENAELKKKCYKKAVKDYCELEKENAELKHTIATLRQEKDNVSMHAKAMEVVAKTKSDQLINAKEIIRALLFHLNKDTFSVIYETQKESIERAEQFISEVEK